ncbi:hypothetical protein BGZ65_001790, partial [Modicella reniformis]
LSIEDEKSPPVPEPVFEEVASEIYHYVIAFLTEGIPRQPSKRTDCQAKFTAYLGSLKCKAMKLRCLYQGIHNHDLSSDDSLSERAVRRIKTLLLRGLSIQKVLLQLGQDAERYRRRSLVSGKWRLTRDDFFTYSDVANIYEFGSMDDHPVQILKTHRLSAPRRQ